MKYLAIIFIILPVFAFAHDPNYYHDVIYIEDITQEPWDPEPIDTDLTSEEADEINRRVDEANERFINQYLEDLED